MVSIPGVENISLGWDWIKIFVWIGYCLLGFAISGAFIILWYVTSFKFKATVYPMYGSGSDEGLSVGKAKKNRFKEIKNHWKPMFPLFNKREVEPFPPKYIYPGNKVIAFMYDGEFIPGSINISKEEKNKLEATIDPVPHYIRNWQSVQHQKNELEFQKKDWWTHNKQLFITLAIVFLLLASCVATIYFNFKYAGGKAGSMDNLANAIRNSQIITGR